MGVEILELNEGLDLRGRGEADFGGGVESRAAAGGQREMMLDLGGGVPTGVGLDGGSCTSVDTCSGSRPAVKALCGDTERPPTEMGTVALCVLLFPERESERRGSGVEDFVVGCGAVEDANGEAERALDETQGA